MTNKDIKRYLTTYYNTCPLCKWPTNESRLIQWNRECIACVNAEWYGYDYKPMEVTEEMIARYKDTEKQIINYKK